MANNQTITNIINYGPELLVKWLSVAGLAMYMVFAIVVLRQTAIMTETFESEVNVIVRLFAWLHLGMAIGLVIVGMLWL